MNISQYIYINNNKNKIINVPSINLLEIIEILFFIML